MHANRPEDYFDSAAIIPRDSTNGLSSLRNYTTPSIAGLTDYAAMKLPAGFFNKPMKLVQDIRSRYIAGGSNFSDFRQKKLFNNKGKEEYFINHNTVQINSITNGGIGACPFGTVEECMQFAGSCLGIVLTGLADNLVGGLVFLSGASPLVYLILTDSY